jgi:hypothetical protein
MKYTLPVLMALASLPLGAVEDPLFQVHVMGRPADGDLGRPWPDQELDPMSRLDPPKPIPEQPPIYVPRVPATAAAATAAAAAATATAAATASTKAALPQSAVTSYVGATAAATEAKVSAGTSTHRPKDKKI